MRNPSLMQCHTKLSYPVLLHPVYSCMFSVETELGIKLRFLNPEQIDNL